MSAPTRAAHLLDIWTRFWFAPIAPHVYALLRITLGLSACALILTRSDIGAFWDPSGFVPNGGSFAEVKQWLRTHELGAVAGAALFWGTVLVFAAMTVGAWARLTVPLSFLAALMQARWNWLPMTGGDEALRSLLFCLMWADTSSVWSIDAWRRRGSRADASPAPMAPLRLLRFQLALVYLSAGLFKIDSAEWRDGSAVYYVLNSNVHQRVPYFVPAHLEWLTTVATYVTLVWELTFAPLLLFKPTRALALVLGVCIHLGMLTFMEVGPFHFVMLAAYPAFVAPETIARLMTRRRRATKPSPALTVS